MRIGVSRNDITPAGPVWLAGYGHRHQKSEGVYHSLRAGAVFLDGDDDTALILAADLIGYSLDLAAGIKLEIAEATGLLPRQIVLTSTHTHGGPYIQPWAMTGEIETDYVSVLCQRLVEMSSAAQAAAVAGGIRFARGRSEFGVNRRLPDGKGGVEFAPNPDGAIDRDLDTLWFEDEGGTPLATLTFYGCHATSIGDDNLGADYPGYLCDALEAATGAPAFFAAACAGDVRPWYVKDAGKEFVRPTLDAVEAAGADIAGEVLATRDEAMAVDFSNLHIINDFHSLPYAELPSRDMLTATAGGSDPHLRRWAQVMLWRYDAGGLPSSCPQEIQILQLNPDFRVVFMGGEILSEIGMHIKRRLQPAVTVAAGYSNGLIAYVPSENAYDLGGYEVDGSHCFYLRPAQFTKDVERLIVDKTVAMTAL